MRQLLGETKRSVEDMEVTEHQNMGMVADCRTLMIQLFSAHTDHELYQAISAHRSYI